MGESRQLKDDHFESFEEFIRTQCKKINDLKKMQKNSGAKDSFSDWPKCNFPHQIWTRYGPYHMAKNLKKWLKIDTIELPSIDECKSYLENNLPNNDFVQAFFFNSTGNIGLFRRLFTDPIPGYYLTTDTIAVDLLVQEGFQNHFFSLIDLFRVLSSQHNQFDFQTLLSCKISMRWIYMECISTQPSVFIWLGMILGSDGSLQNSVIFAK